MRLYIVWTYSPSGDSGIHLVTEHLQRACQERERILGLGPTPGRFDVRIAAVETEQVYDLGGVLDEHHEAICGPYEPKTL